VFPVEPVDARRRPRGPAFIGVVSGVAGGGIAVIGAVVAVAVAGGLGSGATVTVERTTVEATAAPPALAGSDHVELGFGAHEVPELSAREVYERDVSGVVSVSVNGEAQASSPSTSELLKGEEASSGPVTGSGFEIDGTGTILTAWHVVMEASSVRVRLHGGRTLTARVVGKDPAHDLALLRIPTDGLTLHPLPLGDSDRVHVGDGVYTISSAFGLEGTLTTGVISALQRRITAPSGVAIPGVLQTDAPINAGSSGGPLLNSAGEVVGVAAQIETRGGGGDVGVGFAIPIDAVKSQFRALGKR
jgi:S1-C subfamily serine protease